MVLASALALSAAATGAEPFDARVREAQKVVESIRGVPFRQPVASRTIAAGELPGVLARKLVEDLPVPFERYAASLAAIGLIDPAPGLLGRLTNLYSRQVVGFYDPREKRFAIVPERIADGTAGGGGSAAVLMEEALLVHELTHALQDQRLGLAKRFEALRESTDGSLALQALLEGEATLVMADAILARLPEAARPDPSKGGLETLLAALRPASVEGSEGVPEYFVRQLLFPYVDGTARISALRKERGWAAVDALYRNPPETTLEVLHPERAGSRRRLPASLRPAPADLPAGSVPLYSDTLGAFSLAVLLERSGAEEAAGGLASAWQDDRVLYYTPKGRSGQQIGFLWRILCESPAVAREMADRLRPLYETRPAPARPVVRSVEDMVEVTRVVAGSR